MTDPNVALRTSLYAAVGAGDAVVQAVADVVAQVRERAENTQVDVNDRVETARERIASVPADLTETIESLRSRLGELPAELPEELADLRERFSAEELRKVAEAYLKVASDLYTAFAERGEETIERLRQQPAVEERLGRAEAAFGDVVDLTEDALGTVARQTRTVGEQAAKFAGLTADRISETATEVGDAIADAGDDAALRVLELGDQAEEASGEAATRVESVKDDVDEAAETVTEKAEQAASKPVAKSAPAKAPAKKAPAKTVAKAPAKKAAPRKTTGA
ncbi:heparin binding hemagglutinin HbhA [Rhodococcus sp. SMB37]|uniref:heparin-binding hemagglutinin n=1 Tax=Rhodococcus sp. SMB37 TaxID=2512213 RepID=UPI00104485E8|nr:heparin-binding hemagglutinin [Rhodococcus sp. SMB37]TCN54195.1 heparin binding hemagglutinin HbhA [Rhodococcus sp. SMB37]